MPTVRNTTAAAAHPVEPVGGLDELAAAFRTLCTEDEVKLFLRDLCTLPELEALAHRWQTARLVAEGVPYLEVAGRVPTSTATVTRVAQWLKHGTGGYRIALERDAIPTRSVLQPLGHARHRRCGRRHAAGDLEIRNALGHEPRRLPAVGQRLELGQRAEITQKQLHLVLCAQSSERGGQLVEAADRLDRMCGSSRRVPYRGHHASMLAC